MVKPLHPINVLATVAVTIGIVSKYSPVQTIFFSVGKCENQSIISFSLIDNGNRVPVNENEIIPFPISSSNETKMFLHI